MVCTNPHLKKKLFINNLLLLFSYLCNLKKEATNYSPKQNIMKKTLLLACIAVVSVFTAMAQSEQFVSTTPSNKNVVIEEYTGINCGYCPDGHRIANEIVAANPGRAFAINVHQGSYAANTYTTSFGNALANQIGLSGYPAGTVNRHIFSTYSSVLDLGRGYWSTCANQILGQSSPVNIAARGTLDWSTRELNITVQVYYTSDEGNTTNKLNIAILQDNVLGTQSGMSSNPSQVVGSQYRHMHMLRHLITGQWGDELTPCTAGSFIEKTYTYTIPETLGSPNAIQAKLEDLEFIAFVAEGNQEILTGCQVEIENTNMPSLNPRIDGLSQVALNDCSDNAKAKIAVSNIGSEAITSLNIEYTVAGGAAQNYNWTGNIASMASTEIELPTLTVTVNTNQTVTAKVVEANGQTFAGNQVSATIKKSVVAGGSGMVLKVKGDGYSGPYTYNGNTYQGEQSFKLYDPSGSVIQQATYQDFTSSAISEFPLNITTTGCHKLIVYDAYGDGISSGYVRLYDANGNQLYNASGTSFTTELVVNINIGTVNIDEAVTADDMVIFPNPATDRINITSEASIQQVELYNLQGQCVAAKSGDIRVLSLNGLANGMYILKVTTENGVSTYKVSKR